MPNANIKKNYIYNLSFQIFSLLIPFVTAPYVSRVLLPTGVGTYSYVNSIATYFSLLAALGISSYGTREVSRVRDNPKESSRLFWELSLLRIFSTVACVILYAGFIFITGSDWSTYLAAGVLILSVGVDCSWYFQAHENFKVLMLRNFIVKSISVACIFLFVKKPSDLVLYIFIQAGGMFLSNVVLWTSLTRQVVFIPLNQLRFKKHLKETFVYFIPTIATSVYTVLDKTMIGMITKDMAQNGYYEQAHKIINMLMTLITSLNVVVGVRTSYLFGQERKQEIQKHILNTFRFIYLMAFPLATGIAACAPTFVPWFYGAGYDQVVPLMQMFSPLLFVIGTSNVLGTLYLTPSGQRARSNRAIIAGAVTNFLLNMVLIKWLGVYGAVISSVVAELLISALYLYFSYDFVSVKQIGLLALRYAVLAGIMFVPTYYVGRVISSGVLATVVQVAVGCSVYFVLLVVTKDPFLLEEIQTVKEKLGR